MTISDIEAEFDSLEEFIYVEEWEKIQAFYRTKITSLLNELRLKQENSYKAGSENNDIYEAYDNGWNRAVAEVDLKINKLLNSK